MDNQKITMPVGFLAGQSIPLDMALSHLALEMLGRAADLEERAARGDPDEAALLAKAAELRRYGWALWLVWLQSTPNAEAAPALGSPELAEAAELYRLALPPAE